LDRMLERASTMQDREVTPSFQPIGFAWTLNVGVDGEYCFGDCDRGDAADCKYE
jgi:hypothetical protein